MKTINGDNCWQVKDLKTMLEGEPDDAIVYATYTDADGKYKQRPIYKNSTASDDSEHYLYVNTQFIK